MTGKQAVYHTGDARILYVDGRKLERRCIPGPGNKTRTRLQKK